MTSAPQVSLFDTNPTDFSRELMRPKRAETWMDLVDSPRRYTKELVHLGDVPVGLAGESAVQNIPLQVTAKNGGDEVISYPGKVLHRHVPAPHVVRQNGHIIPRHAAKPGGHIEQVFMHLQTRVLYTMGIVTPMHYEVFLAVVYLWWKRYLGPSRDSSPTITTTRHEIAEALGTQTSTNGHVRREIPKALMSMKGLQVFKDYESEEEEVEPLSVMAGTLIQKVTIQGRNIDDVYGPNAGGKKRKTGARREQITITLGTELIDAILGKDELLSQAIAVRTLRLDQTVRHKGWKQGLFRMIELRLERHERFAIPLEEVWVQILGMNPEDVLDSTVMRQVRLKVRKCLREWSSIEYINYQTSDREAGIVYHDSRPYSAARWIDNEWVMQTFLGGDWIEIERGATFMEGRPLQQDEIEERVLATAGFENAKTMVESMNRQVLIDVRRRLRDLIGQIGDDHGRLNTWQWFTPNYPKPNRDDMLRRALLEVSFRKADSDKRKKNPYPVAAHRRLKIERAYDNLYGKAGDTPIFEYLEDCLQGGEPNGSDRPTLVLYRAALNAVECLNVLLERHGRIREDFESWKLEVDDNLREVWNDLREDAARAGIRCAVELHWYEVIEEKVGVLPPIDAQAGSVTFRERLMAAVSTLKVRGIAEVLNDYRRGQRACEWTRRAADIMERRLVEAAVEHAVLWPDGRQ